MAVTAVTKVIVSISASVKKLAEAFGKLGDALFKLVGVAPRRNFKKFQATIYPVLRAQAQAAGIKVYAFWFGDVIEVTATGEWQVVATQTTLSNAELFWNQLEAQGDKFAVFRCNVNVDFRNVSEVASSCQFEFRNQEVDIEGEPGGGKGIVAAAIAAGAAIFLNR